MLSTLQEYEYNKLNINCNYFDELKIYEDEIYKIYNEINKKNKLMHIENNINIITLYISILIIIYPNKTNNEITNHALLNFIASNIYKWYIINNVDTEYTFIRKNIYKSIAILENSNIINFKKKTINNKTIKYINQNKTNIFEKIIIKKYSYEKYKLITYKNKNYTWTNHFFNINEIEKYNEFNKKTIKFKTTETTEKILNNYYYIDWKLYELLLKTKINKYGFNEILEVLETYNIYINNKNLITKQTEKKISIIMKFIDEIDFLIINNNNNNPIYFQHSFDFRGRLYYDSTVSPTNSKITRNSICNKKTEKTNTKTKTDYIIEDQIWILNAYDQYKNLSLEDKKKIFWILISIGKIFKNKKSMETSDFIIQAITNIDKEPKNIDDELDLIKYKYMHNIILNKKKTEYIHTIVKDATASGFQHLIKLLKTKNEIIYTFANFNSSTRWYDTYSYLKDIYISNNDVDSKYHIYFERNLIKKLIMIELYGASKRTCINEYIKKININEKNKSDIINEIMKFYEYLHNNTSDLLIEKIKPNSEDIELHDSIINIAYYKKKKKQHSYIQNSIRKTIQEYQLTDEVNIKKTIKAYKANITHASDAYTVRQIINKWYKPIITIHDAFIVDIDNISEFIDLYNKIIKEQPFIYIHNQEINENYHSIFIVI